MVHKYHYSPKIFEKHKRLSGLREIIAQLKMKHKLFVYVDEMEPLTNVSKERHWIKCIASGRKMQISAPCSKDD